VQNMGVNVPVQERFFEDYLPGSVHRLGTIPVTEEEIIEFGRRYDPQVFHTDPVKARETAFGGLVASGWHTAAMAMRLLVERYLSPVSSVGSPGLKELWWLKPVRPGDSLTVRVTVLETRKSDSRPDRGIVRSLVEVINQEGDIVMRCDGVNIILCRSV